jgi:ABC-type sugar transport system ATPase subunit
MEGDFKQKFLVPKGRFRREIDVLGDQKDILLSMLGIVKKFPGVVALNKVDFEVSEGEVHGLLGQNGAGKSTLIKILVGALRKDDGKILWKGKERVFSSPMDAQRNGIGIVYQEINLLPNLTVAENIFLGHRFPKKKGGIDWHSLFEKADEILKSIDINIDPRTPVGLTSVSLQQMVAIARALNFDPKLLIMDEPTSSIGKEEVDHLFKVIASIKRKGVGVIFISHKLEEIFEICDRVTVLRDGEKVGTWDVKGLDRVTLVEAIVGKKGKKLLEGRSGFVEKKNGKKTLLEVSSLNDRAKLLDVNFKVKKGEVVGFAGLLGSGRTETMKCVIGARKRKGGRIILEAKEINPKDTLEAKELGIVYSPEDRKLEGLILGRSVMENILLPNLSKFSKFGFVNRRKAMEVISDLVKILDIKTPTLFQKVGNLSGGNQQKVVLAKWLLAEPQVLFLDEPTRGIDVGAKVDILDFVRSMARNKNIGVIMASSEFAELLSYCDRIYVIHNGETVACLNNNEELTEQEIFEKIAIVSERSSVISDDGKQTQD